MTENVTLTRSNANRVLGTLEDVATLLPDNPWVAGAMAVLQQAIAAGDHSPSENSAQPEPEKCAELPPLNCRQRLRVEGKPYPKSSCAFCGQFSPNWRVCESLLHAPTTGVSPD